MAEDLENTMTAWEPPGDFDGFHVIRPIGRGGMGRVFLAREVPLGRLVAIKFDTHFPNLLGGDDRFDHEAQALARLQHPNVVSIYHRGSVNHTDYLALEFVFGRVLSQMPRPVNIEMLSLVAKGLLHALSACHSAGIIHRDVKPSNVILSHAGCIKLVDFGLAQLGPPNGDRGDNVAVASMAPVIIDGTPTVRVASSSDRPSSAPPPSDLQIDTPFAVLDGSSAIRDSDGLLIGTPLYMAPERWLGRRATARSDLFALGILLRELAVGQHPYAPLHGSALMRAVLDQDLPTVEHARPDLPHCLIDVLDRLTCRAESDRPESADEVLALLARPAWDFGDEEHSAVYRREGLSPARAPAELIAIDEKIIGRVG